MQKDLMRGPKAEEDFLRCPVRSGHQSHWTVDVHFETIDERYEVVARNFVQWQGSSRSIYYYLEVNLEPR